MIKIKGELMLFAATFIWGSAYIFKKMGMDYIDPFTFSFFRFGLGALVMIPVILVADAAKKRKSDCDCNRSSGRANSVMPFTDRNLLIGSLACGIVNFVAGSLQQVGLVYTDAGKAGFITAIYIVIVPILLVFMKRHVHGLTWLGVAMAGVGLYMLCITDGFSIALGDGLVMGCAVVYSIQILLIDYYSKLVDPIKLSFFSFVLSALLSLIVAVFAETIVFADVVACTIPLLYTAILEVSVAFTLQIVGQRYTPPAIATIIMSLESVFAALCGALILNEFMSGREIMGCVIMAAAFIIAQIPEMRGGSEQ